MHTADGRRFYVEFQITPVFRARDLTTYVIPDCKPETGWWLLSYREYVAGVLTGVPMSLIEPTQVKFRRNDISTDYIVTNLATC